MKKSQGQRSAKKGGTIIGRRSSPTSTEEALVHTLRNTIFHDLHCLPQDLRKSPVFEVFLNHMFPVSLSKVFDIRQVSSAFQDLVNLLPYQRKRDEKGGGVLLCFPCCV